VFDVIYMSQYGKYMTPIEPHTFMILTKRPENALKYITYALPRWGNKPFKNLWLGVTAENQEQADKRIPILLQTPAAVRFVSVEPMLGPVDLEDVQFDKFTRMNVLEGCGITTRPRTAGQSMPNCYCNKLDWVICGGESGPGARPAKEEWVRDLKNQCVASGTKFFLKQMEVDGKLVKMPELDGKVWDEYPGGI
jgi:protein gp37